MAYVLDAEPDGRAPRLTRSTPCAGACAHCDLRQSHGRGPISICRERAATPARSVSSRNRRTSRRSGARACFRALPRHSGRRHRPDPRGGAGPAEHHASLMSRLADGTVTEVILAIANVEERRPPTRACSPRWALDLAPGDGPAHGRRPGVRGLGDAGPARGGVTALIHVIERGRGCLTLTRAARRAVSPGTTERT